MNRTILALCLSLLCKLPAEADAQKKKNGHRIPSSKTGMATDAGAPAAPLPKPTKSRQGFVLYDKGPCVVADLDTWYIGLRTTGIEHEPEGISVTGDELRTSLNRELGKIYTLSA